MGNYKPGDQIMPAQAWVDLKADFHREEWSSRPFHVWTDIWVNLARICGISDRDTSQIVGRVFAVGIPLTVGFLIYMALRG